MADRWVCRICLGKLPEELTKVSDTITSRKCEYCGIRNGEVWAIDAPDQLDIKVETNWLYSEYKA